MENYYQQAPVPEPPKIKKKKRIHKPFVVSLLLNLFLIVTVFLMGLALINPAVPASSGSGTFFGGQNDLVTVNRADLEDYAENTSSIMELLQRIYTDEIVYKDAQGHFVYEPIDGSLALHNYNWDNLVRLETEHKEFAYVVDGEVKSQKGIDVSKYQGDIDWESVAEDGVEFAMIRVGYRGYTEGSLIEDPCFIQNIQGALEAGIKVGVYFYSQAINEQEAVEEAEFVLSYISNYDITWPVALDLEDAGAPNARAAYLTKEQNTKNAVAFCETIKEAGYNPMVYCNIRWFMQRLDFAELEGYGKWFAQYYNRPGFPYNLQIWQYSSSGTVSGISGHVDMNLGLVNYSE